jgi:hypothetical protein
MLEFDVRAHIREHWVHDNILCTLYSVESHNRGLAILNSSMNFKS